MQADSGSRRKKEKKGCFKATKQNIARTLILMYKKERELLKMTPVSNLGEWKLVVLCQNRAYEKRISCKGKKDVLLLTMKRNLLLKDVVVRILA